MDDQMQDRDADGMGRFQPADPRTKEEVGGVLERAFQREGGREPNQEDARCFIELAGEAEKKAEAAESLAGEASDAAARALDLYGRTGSVEDLAAAKRLEEEAAQYRREAEAMRTEAERLRQYLPALLG